MTTNYSNVDLDSLTEQEREGILEIQREMAEEASETETPEAAGEEVKPDAETKEGEVETREATGERTTDEPEPITTTTSAAFPVFDAPADATTRVSEIDKEIAELGQDFADGGMSHHDFQIKLMQLHNERADIKEQLFKASLSQDVHQRTWEEVTVPAFLDSHPEYRQNQVLFDSLNIQVQRLQVENPNKPFDAAILAQAHQKLATVFNFAGNQQAATQTQPVKSQATTPALPREMPPSLGRVPASDMTEAADGGRFAHLDVLAQSNKAEEYERELAKLSDSDRAAYLQMG